jgi:hypothetical protein
MARALFAGMLTIPKHDWINHTELAWLTVGNVRTSILIGNDGELVSRAVWHDSPLQRARIDREISNEEAMSFFSDESSCLTSAGRHFLHS